ncbi:MAG: hypothetical protein NBKEAIPA_02830 [Nitrospirae bacterium]|nr:hypothetical protein [Nitrospirota bacterium]
MHRRLRLRTRQLLTSWIRAPGKTFSLCNGLGALATAAGCAKLETLGREAHLETAPALVQELVLGHQSTCQAIEMELRARTGH